MQQIIQQLAQSAGVDEGQANSVVKVILDMVQKHADPADAQQMISSLPGGTEMAAEAQGAADEGKGAEGGGLLGGVMGAVGGMLGGKAGDAAGAISALTATGLDMGQIKATVSQFVEIAKQHVGEETVERIVAKIPGLSSVI